MIGLGYNSVDKVLDSQASGSEFDSPEKPEPLELADQQVSPKQQVPDQYEIVSKKQYGCLLKDDNEA